MQSKSNAAQGEERCFENTWHAGDDSESITGETLKIMQ